MPSVRVRVRDRAHDGRRAEVGESCKQLLEPRGLAAGQVPLLARIVLDVEEAGVLRGIGLGPRRLLACEPLRDVLWRRRALDEPVLVRVSDLDAVCDV